MAEKVIKVGRSRPLYVCLSAVHQAAAHATSVWLGGNGQVSCTLRTATGPIMFYLLSLETSTG